MSSILTNTAAMTALQNLAATQKDLTKTQAQISSGLAVANASDNAAYWSISTTMKSDVGAIGAVTNALNLGASVLNSATSALNSVETILKQMKVDIATAQTTGTNIAQVQSDIAAQQQSLANIMGSASFNGVNLLDGSTSSTNIVSSFARNSDSESGANNTALGFITVGTGSVALAATSATDPSSGTANAGTAGGLLGASLGLSAASRGSGIGFEADGTTPKFYTGTLSTTDTAALSPVASPVLTPVASPVTIRPGGSSTTTLFPGTRPVHPVGPAIPIAALPTTTVTVTGYTGVFNSDSILGFKITAASSTVPSGGVSDLTALSNAIDKAIADVTSAGAILGQYQTTVSNQLAYNAALSDAITSGVGSLVDADMNVASTRLQALQTQQQLGIQALSIANQNSQLVLKLFQ